MFTGSDIQYGRKFSAVSMRMIREIGKLTGFN